MDRFYVRDARDVLRAQNLFALEQRVGFDIETSGLHARAIIAGFSLHFPQQQTSCYVPLYHRVPGGGISGCVVGWGTLEADAEDWEWLRYLQTVTFHGAFDLGRFRFLFPNFVPIPVGDAQTAAKMLQVKRWESLKDLAETMGVRRETISIEEVLGSGNYDFTYALLNDLTLAYTCQDAELAVEVEAKVLETHLKRDKYPGWDQVYALECRMMPILGELHCQGIPLDKEEFIEQIDELDIEATEEFRAICEMLNRDPDHFKLSSSKRLSAALFNPVDHEPQELRRGQHADLEQPGLGLNPPTRKGKSGAYSTAVQNLQVIEDQHPVIPHILGWKKLNSFLTRDAKHVDEWVEDDRIYPNFVQVGEDGTSRIYAKSPNVIGMSHRTRASMHPEPGCCYCHVDYRLAEFRLGMFFANEEGFLAALDRGLDAHKYTYSVMAGIDIEAVTADQRRVGKVLNFASLFGSQGFSVARALQLETTSEAVRLLDEFWNAYPRLRQWYDYRQNYAREHARTYTLLGRVRRLPGIFSDRWSVQKSEMRKAVNTACQGSCGDVLKVAMVNFDVQCRDLQSPLYAFHGKMVCPVYDACLLSFTDSAMGHKEIVENAIRRAFEVEIAIGPYSDVAADRTSRRTILPVDVGWSSENWLEAMLA